MMLREALLSRATKPTVGGFASEDVLVVCAQWIPQVRMLKALVFFFGSPPIQLPKHDETSESTYPTNLLLSFLYHRCMNHRLGNKYPYTMRVRWRFYKYLYT